MSPRDTGPGGHATPRDTPGGEGARAAHGTPHGTPHGDEVPAARDTPIAHGTPAVRAAHAPRGAGRDAGEPAPRAPRDPGGDEDVVEGPGLRQLLAGLTAVRDGDFRTRLSEDEDGVLGEIAVVFNGMVDQLSLFTSEVTRVAREVGTDGRLGGQAEVPGVSGTWKDLTDSVNAMAGNLTAQVRDIAQVATAVAEGDLSQKITVDVKGEILELKVTINTMVDQLSAFADEVTRVAREVGSEGRLGGQAEVQGVSGTWRDLTDSVNFMADNLTDQVREIAQVTTAVARGDLSQKITVDARGEILALKNTVNTMVDQLSAFADEVTRVAREVGTEGILGGQARVPTVAGTWKDLTDNVNVMASNLTTQVRSIATVAAAVAGGDLSKKVDVQAKGEVAALADTIDSMVDTLSAFADEVTRVAREVGTEGILGGQARVPGVAGTWKDLTDNVNSMANNLTAQVRNIAQVTTAVAQGDLRRKIDVDARGEILTLKTTINTMVDQLSAFADEVTRVAREVGTEGRLGGQAEVEGVSGTWKRLTENVNELAGNLTRQVRAIAEVTSAVTRGDLTRSISVEAQGEVAELKDNINSMVVSLRQTTRANLEQNWLKTNLARVSGLMQGHRDLAVVADLVMEELTPLVEAQYGAFFLVEDDELRLIAGYGVPAVPSARRSFRFGESLVGQAAKSRRTIAVNDVEAEHLTIASGLMRARPASLLLLPIVFEDQVLGVIELAALGRFTQIHRDFLDQLMELVGVNINTLIANARTDALLAESQRLADELRVRSVELQARQDELQRSNAELEEKAALLVHQNTDIEAKNRQIEQARQELEVRARELTRASRYKSEFLANMSHELRTPLNSLLVLAQLLAGNTGGNLTAEQVGYARVIHSAGSDLLQLINDILDLSKVEAGKMDVRVETFPLSRLVAEVEETFRPLTGDKGLAFRVSVGPGVPGELRTDPQRLRQILHNLVANAVKFTEHGEVLLRVRSEPGSGSILFQVTDTGIGIPEDKLAAIFGAFQQADGTTSRRYGGTGLGLSISREIASLLGGELVVESAEGRGSTFTLRLPGPAGAAGPAPDTAAEPARPPRDHPAERVVLVVERREPGLLGVLARHAADAVPAGSGPVRVRTVTGPDDALAVLRGDDVACVVLDLGAADGPALDLLDEIAGAAGRPGPPVLAHHPGPGEPAPDRLARARARVTRLEVSASLDELREGIAGCLSPAGDGPSARRARDARAAGPPAAAPGDLTGRKVLIVDDDARNVFALTSILELHGLTVLYAENGRKGIEVLTRNEDVDLILMDVMMPEMDGYATTQAIRAMPRHADLPIIAVTAKAMRGDREKSLAAGASDHVTKPVDTDELLACIRRWLGLPAR